MSTRPGSAHLVSRRLLGLAGTDFEAHENLSTKGVAHGPSVSPPRNFSCRADYLIGIPSPPLGTTATGPTRSIAWCRTSASIRHTPHLPRSAPKHGAGRDFSPRNSGNGGDTWANGLERIPRAGRSRSWRVCTGAREGEAYGRLPLYLGACGDNLIYGAQPHRRYCFQVDIPKLLPRLYLRRRLPDHCKYASLRVWA